METPTRADEGFVPYGALAFFAALILLTVFIWLASYFLMLKRG